MPKQHTVVDGDTVASLAAAAGLTAATIWMHPDNAALRESREHPNLLEPGDVLVIPDLRPKEVKVATGQSHKFVRNETPEPFQARFLDSAGNPRAGVPYLLEIDDVAVAQDTLPADGSVKTMIHPAARSVRVTLNESGALEIFRARMGYLTPLAGLRSVQQRLRSLGHDCPTDGTPGDATRNALLAFQREAKLDETGEADEATKEALREWFGS